MSRYELVPRKPRYQVFVGWDRPLLTYFLQVHDTLASPDSQPFTWLGADGKSLDYTDLTRALEPFAALPLEIAVKLCADRGEER
jgi:hypothetical protein